MAGITQNQPRRWQAKASRPPREELTAMKIALLGTGFGQAHAAVYAQRPDVDEVVIFGRTSEKLAKISGQFGRMLHHGPTGVYLARRAGHKTEREIRRCLKRYAARSLYRLMETAART
jgi:shikimate 5-dehydrogenase